MRSISCIACEDRPEGENNPCSVCGKEWPTTDPNQPTVTEADAMCARTILANPTMLAATLAISDHREAAMAELRAENERLREAVQRARRHAENIGITDGSYIAMLDEALGDNA